MVSWSGFPRTVQALFENDWPTSAELWLPDGKIPVEGFLFVTPAYAATLQRFIEEGQAAGADREMQIDAARRA